MYRSLRNIVLITAVLIIGCAEPPNDGLTGPLAGIKLKDLRPADAYETPEEIHFRIFTFELPAKNFGLLEGTFESLWNSPLRFINYKAFSANGFSAGLGRDRMWDTVADKLRKAGAKKTKISALIIFDNTGNDFVAAGLSEEKTVFYTDTDNATLKYATGAFQCLSTGLPGDTNCDGIDGVDADKDGHASLASGGDDCDDGDPQVP